jgi:hypothetical protein
LPQAGRHCRRAARPEAGACRSRSAAAAGRAREAARRAQKLQTFGLSASGAQQFAAGLPVHGIEDRRLLPQIVMAALGGALPAHSGGGYNQMILNDTKGKEDE